MESGGVCFFFSSRRRHTRSLCDWSSDVCSSDLLVTGGAGRMVLAGPATYTGTTNVTAGALLLTGAGAITNTSAVTVASRARLTFDNSTTNLANRLADSAPITLGGGTLSYAGNAAAWRATLGATT